MAGKTLNTTILIIAFIALLWPFGAVSQAAAPSADLQAALQSSAADEEIPVIVTLRDEVNRALFTSEDKNVRRRQLVQALKDQAELKHKPLIDLLESRGVSNIHSLWIINGLALKASPAVIQELADRPEVESIRLDRVVGVPPVTRATPTAQIEWNINAINAPDLWKLGYTGKGVVVANMDTGVDLNHPDLTSKWRGGANSWHDPYGGTTTPYDVTGHGTQTMGIMVGGSAGGTAIGVAPDAQWIAAKISDDSGNAQLSYIHDGFQWLLDLDGNLATNDAPDVVNISWAWDSGNPCDPEFAPDVQKLEIAGIAVVFSAGDYGPHPRTSVPPANNPGNFSVGATDETSFIADFSSRGPSSCGGSTIYPTVVAPGVSVKTADLTYGGLILNPYATVSGTSFSSPHAAGAVALLLSAFPQSTVADLESALEKSALDLGAKGPDNTYGHGLLDVSKAYAVIIAGKAPPVAFNDAYVVGRNGSLVVAPPGVLKNDTGSGALTAILVTRVSHGFLVLHSNGSFTYRPRRGFTGSDSFTYQASQASNGALSKPATVTIEVKALLSWNDIMQMLKWAPRGYYYSWWPLFW